MNLLIAFVHGDDVAAVVQKLSAALVPVTVLESRGGFLKRTNQTLLMAVAETRTDEVLNVLRLTCTRRSVRVDTMFAGGMIESLGLPAATDVEVGGATVLILAVTRVEKI